MSHEIRATLTAAAKLDYDAAFYLGRVTGSVLSPRTSEALRRTLESLDFDSFQRIRSIRTTWPEFKGKGNPHDVRDSDARTRLARELEQSLASAFATMFRFINDPSMGISPGCLNDIVSATRAIVSDAWDHGAITRAQCAALQALIRGAWDIGHSYATPTTTVYYVNGYRIEGWDKARAMLAAHLMMPESEVTLPKVWDRYVHQRSEWKNHPGQAAHVPLSAHYKDDGTKMWDAYAWVPVREPKCSVDAERNMAAWFVCCAFASVNARSSIPAYRVAQMSERFAG